MSPFCHKLSLPPHITHPFFVEKRIPMITKQITRVFLGLMALAFCKVGIEAMVNPQAVLAQVGITLDNPSALSSMRAVYGGMHFIFGLFCIWGIFKNPSASLQMVTLYTLGFIIGRVSGFFTDGAPNAFVLTWLITETVSFIIAIVLWRLQSRSEMARLARA